MSNGPNYADPDDVRQIAARIADEDATLLERLGDLRAEATRPELTGEQRRRLDAIEAAPAAEESLRERVARAIGSESIGVTLTTDDEWHFYLRPDEHDDFRRMADAALAVIRGEQ